MFQYLDVYIMYIISKERKINLGQEVDSVYSLGTLMVKRVWRVYDLETGELFVSGDVIFHEDIHPLANNEDESVVEDHDLRWILNASDND